MKRSRDPTRWEAQLARLAAYKASHGDCHVPVNWAEDLRLASWVRTQRGCKRKLDRGETMAGDSYEIMAERVGRLAALGFDWDPPRGPQNRGLWDAQLARLAAYKVAHGDCNVPTKWVEDPRLGGWVGNQRNFKRKLDRGEPSHGMTVERAAKLTALGFTWDPLAAGGGQSIESRSKDAQWEAQLAQLAAYRAEHGDCNVPARWTEDPRLATWIGNHCVHDEDLRLVCCPII
jgi:hypothetical protein